MKRTVVLSLIAVVLGIVVAAAPLVGQVAVPAEKIKKALKSGPGSHERASIAAMYDELRLSDEQKQKIDAILEEYRGKIDPLEKQIDQLRQERDKKAREVLEPEQQTRLDQLMRRAEQRRGKGPHSDEGDARGNASEKPKRKAGAKKAGSN